MVDESANEIDHGETSLRKNPLESETPQRDPALPTNGEPIASTAAPQADLTHSTADTVIDETAGNVSD